MRQISRPTAIWVATPVVSNLVLATLSVSFSDRFWGPWICYVVAVAAITASSVSLCSFALNYIGPRSTFLGLLVQGASLILIFAAIYHGNGLSNTPNPLWDTALYFSVVTWTTLGYGDFTVLPPLRLIAAAQALLGYVFLGLTLGLGTVFVQRRMWPRPPD